MDVSARTFSAIDYVVFGCMLLISTAIGIYYMIKDRKKQTTEEYLLGGRSMSSYPVAFSLSVSFMSGVLILGTTAEVYRYGTVYVWLLVAYVVMAVITAEIYIPTFYRMKLASVYEYLEKRFSRTIRIQGTILYMLHTIPYIGIVIYAPALAVNAVTGLDIWSAAVSTGVICIIYSSMGGLKAVIWTDAFQAVIMLVGFFSILIRGSILLGGIGKIWENCLDGERIELWRFSLDPRIRYTMWNLSIGGTVYYMSLFAVNQGQVQRFLSCRSLREAKKSVLLNIFGLITLASLAILTGLTMYAHYHGCDPLSLGVVHKPDQKRFQTECNSI
ncbi:unnamed protein product [Clavelina lepadiformis]|uniref:Sodium-coupled monocarboxylate transporter 1 n=1 Tax=Clavelina lepadiformis TaxID=159417 RepID=A0ABP0FGZ8_CLALP